MRSILVIFLIIFSINAINAQFKVGVNAGVPSGDASDYYSLSAGLDLYYMFGDSKDALLKFGAATGFLNYFGDDMDGGFSVEDAQYIPLAVAARLTFLSTLTVGPDIGYGIGISDESDGGFYGRLVVGLDLGNTVELNAFYHLISDSIDFGSAGLGVLIVF